MKSSENYSRIEVNLWVEPNEFFQIRVMLEAKCGDKSLIGTIKVDSHSKSDPLKTEKKALFLF